MKRLFPVLLLLSFLVLPWKAAGQRIVLGDEQFDRYLPMLEGKRVAVFSNQSGIVGDVVRGSRLADALSSSDGCLDSGRTDLDQVSLIPFLEPSEPGGLIEYGPHLVDALLERGVDVRLIFSPEHGFRGTADAGEEVGGEVDPKTGIQIHSLFGSGSSRPDRESMDKFDVLLVDIQDVGLRYYTYYVTMLHLMDSCADLGKKVIVLDRPNPNGFYVDGPVLDKSLRSGVGSLPIPTVHGMTLGEMALMINGEGWLECGRKCDLEVIPCLGYTHRMRKALIIPPSPNLKDMRAVYLYASTCYFEGTVVSLGRGTDSPFEVYGHPDAHDYSFSFTPQSIPGAKNPPLLGQECHGEDLRGVPLRRIWEEGINLGYVTGMYLDLGMGEAFFGKNNFFDLLAGVGYVRTMIIAGATADEIASCWEDDVRRFMELRKKYMLYKV